MAGLKFEFTLPSSLFEWKSISQLALLSPYFDKAKENKGRESEIFLSSFFYASQALVANLSLW